ncbi:YceH family protein [Undibacterium sp. Di24W]|uniref:YceH family protein n=1 Tax=Undibacterium sp. Di24W TaxID=3413033 RepID=UPI003BF1CEA6
MNQELSNVAIDVSTAHQPVAENDASLLDDVEVRVLASLAEKEAATPDNYPMSLNALVNACNQLSSRDPVMNLTEDDVVQAIDRLVLKKLAGVIHQAGARVAKYEHRLRIKYLFDQDKLAVLATLMLRGEQTAGEIRSRCGRLHDFSSVEQVEKTLNYLMDKYPPLVTRLAKAPGSKEARYVHLLSSTEEDAQSIAARPIGSHRSEVGGSNADRIASLENEVQALRLQVKQLTEQFSQFAKQFD